MVRPGPAVLGRYQHAHEPEFSQLSQRLFREFLLAVPFSRVRREQMLRDIARRVAEEDLLFAEPHSITSLARQGSRPRARARSAKKDQDQPVDNSRFLSERTGDNRWSDNRRQTDR